MLLLLARHADAGVPDEARWPDDADRPLTDLGRITQRKMGELLRRSRLSPGAIFSSPLRRARQTAEIVAEVCETPAPLRICDALAGPPDLESIAAAVSGQPDAAIVARPAIRRGSTNWRRCCLPARRTRCAWNSRRALSWRSAPIQ